MNLPCRRSQPSASSPVVGRTVGGRVGRALVAAALTVSTSLTGCGLFVGHAVGPDYVPPKITAPETFSENVAGTPALEWWKNFKDPQLNSLIERALNMNLDIKSATAKLRQARAQRAISVAGEFPTVDLDGEFERSQGASALGINSTSAGGTTGTGGTGTGGTGGTGGGSGAGGSSRTRTNLYEAGFDASWELDIWGGVRRGIEAADANLAASVENRRAVIITLLSEVATDYIQLRGFQRQIQIAEDNIKSQRDTLDLTVDKFKAGVDDALNVAQTEALVYSTEATIPELRASALQSIHALSVLLDENPEALAAELGPPRPIPMADIPQVPLGLPSQLLLRRPDVRQA